MEISNRGNSAGRIWPVFLAIILFAAPAFAQKKDEHRSSPPPEQHSAPPEHNNSSSGGSNANAPRGNTGQNGSTTAHNPYGGTASSGTTSHNPYGGTASSGATSHNPYGSYGNAPGSSGTERGSASGSTSHNPYGSYGNAPASHGGAGEAEHRDVYGGSGSGAGSGRVGNGNAANGSRANTEGRDLNEHGGNHDKALGSRGDNRDNALGAHGGNHVEAVNGHGGTSGGGGTGKVVARADGSREEFSRSGRPAAVTSRNGTVTRFNSNGRVASIHRGGLTVDHGARGGRTIVNVRADHSRVVSMGAHRGFVEHPFNRGGHPYLRRTYMDHGRYYARAYRGYYWHGHAWYGYAPAYYYGPRFYGWAYSPWASPVVYSWGWGGSPWYGAYGYYFTPYPVYSTASLWLTDYMISQNLQASYEAQQEQDAGEQAQAAAPPPQQSGGVVLSPEVKQAIADEVKAQLAAEQSASATPTAPPPNVGGEQTPAALDPAFRTFIVSATLSETGPDGTQCSLSPGDVLTRIDDTPDQNQNVTVLVTGSERSDCASGSKLSVGVQDLQDMHNAFNEQIDSGLKTLADNSGKNGLPMAPATNTTPVPDGQAQPDQDAGSDLQQTQQAGNQAESQAGQAQ